MVLVNRYICVKWYLAIPGFLSLFNSLSLSLFFFSCSDEQDADGGGLTRAAPGPSSSTLIYGCNRNLSLRCPKLETHIINGLELILPACQRLVPDCMFKTAIRIGVPGHQPEMTALRQVVYCAQSHKTVRTGSLHFFPLSPS
jgi:hypothetical protein